MKRADVKAGVLYAVKHGQPVMVVDEALWVECRNRSARSGATITTYRPADRGEKSTVGAWVYEPRTVGLPAMERVPLMMPNPEYVGEAEYDRLATELGVRFWNRAQTDTRLQDEIPDPLRWEWKPTILEPKYALEPLDEYEAAVRAEQERDRLEREAMQRKIDALNHRVEALLDVLTLNARQQQDLGSLRYPIGAPRPAEVTLEWLEEVAGRLRQGSGCVDVH